MHEPNGTSESPLESGKEFFSARYHRSIGPEEYEELRGRLIEAVQRVTPPGALVAVVSKGDPDLLEFEDRAGVHFPLDSEGRYAGFHPRTSEDAIAAVEGAQAAGAAFLCLPATAFWWLDHYRGLADWLKAHYQEAVRDDATCVIYDLLGTPGLASGTAATPGGGWLGPLLDALLPKRALLLALGPVEDLAASGRMFEALPTRPEDALRRLASLGTVQETFVVFDRSPAAPPTDPAIEEFFERRAELVARRQGLCDLLRMQPGLDDASRISSESGSRHSAPDPARSLEDATAKRLSDRLERLGLPGQDSSDR